MVIHFPTDRDAERLRAMDRAIHDLRAAVFGQRGQPTRQHRQSMRDPAIVIRLTAIHGDYVEGYVWDGSALGDTLVKVAKPYLLQQTPFDGATVSNWRNSGVEFAFSGYTSDGQERTSTNNDDSSTETQVVTPQYQAAQSGGSYDGDVIQARIGYTAVTDADGAPVVLYDENNDGRAWAQKNE